VCGTLLADDSESCPVCALRGVVETQSDSVLATSSELRFEHYQENGVREVVLVLEELL
jgi:hypothetical protein